MVEGFPALTHRDMRTNGLGYDWNHIQRVKHDGNTWVMLRRDRPKRSHSGLNKRCRCRCPIAPKNTFCSPSCKVEVIQRGRSWQLVQQLVNINFNQLHWRDRYCTTCMQSFSSQHCLSHMSHHPVEHVLVDIAMEEGFPFIVDPDEQLPEVICSRVTRVIVRDGRPTIPLRPQVLPNVNNAHNCTCIMGEWCSVLCKRNGTLVAGVD
uniref:Uncharacterized protein n=1 Tax=Oryza nivara TaxID=4536 RepID=A0A0E0IPY2_ORYNI